MEDNLYHPCVEPFKHQLYFLGNVAVQYFFNFIFLLFYFSYILLPKYFSEPCAHCMSDHLLLASTILIQTISH